jgi:hypothetical protein
LKEKIVNHGYTWENLAKDAKNYVLKCGVCLKNNDYESKQTMGISDSPQQPMEKIALDIVGPLPVTLNDFEYILTCVDLFSRYTWAIPLVRADAESVAEAFMNEVILKVGSCKAILTDQGTCFMSLFFKRFQELLKIKKVVTMAYNQKANGVLERYHKDLKIYLRKFIDDSQQNWDEMINFATMARNITIHSSTKFTLFKLFYGREAILPSAMMSTSSQSISYTDEKDYVDKIADNMKKAAKIAVENSNNAKFKNKLYFDKGKKDREFSKNELVLIRRHNVEQGKTRKLTSPFDGPWKVLSKEGEFNYLVQKGRKKKTVNVNEMKHYYEAKDEGTQVSQRSSNSTLKCNFLIFTMCLFALFTPNESYKIEYLQPGVYTEKIGNLKLVLNHAEVWYNLNMNEIDTNWNKIVKFDNDIRKFCVENDLGKQPCEIIRDVNVQKLNELFNLRNQIFSLHSRKKRGLINGIGTLIKFLFGNMDANDQKRIDARLQKQFKNSENTSKKVEKIENLMTKSINEVDKIVQSCFSNNSIFSRINENFKEIEKRENIAARRVKKGFLLDAMIYAFDEFVSKEKTQLTNIIDTLINFSIGNFHSPILNSNQIIMDISKGNFDTDEFISTVHSNSSLKELKEITRFGAAKINDNFYIIIVIPLVSRETYEIFEVLPIPKIENDIAKTLKIDNSLMVIDKHREKSFKIDKSFFQNLKQINDYFLYDKTIHFSSLDSCSHAIISGLEDMTQKHCEFFNFKLNRPLIIETYNENVILIFSNKKMKIKFIGKNNENINIEKLNLIHINEIGKLFIENQTLLFGGADHLLIKKDIDLKIDFTIIENIIYNDNKTKEINMKLKPIEKTKLALNELKNLSKEWKALKNERDDKDKFHVNLIIILISIITFIILIGCITFSIIKKREKKAKKIELKERIEKRILKNLSDTTEETPPNPEG